MDETVAVHSVALGPLTQYFHVTVPAVWLRFVCSTYIRQSLIGVAAVFIIILLTTSLCQHGSKWRFADCSLTWAAALYS